MTRRTEGESARVPLRHRPRIVTRCGTKTCWGDGVFPPRRGPFCGRRSRRGRNSLPPESG